MTLPSITGKDGCKGEKRDDERKRCAEMYVVQELANMICGQYWGSKKDKDQDYRMTVEAKASNVLDQRFLVERG